MTQRFATAALALCAALAAGAAGAAPILFPDRASFRAATGDTTFEDVNGFTADVPGPFDVGPFSVAATGLWAADNGIEAYDPRPNDINRLNRNVDGTTYLSLDVDRTLVTFSFDAPIRAIAWDQTSTANNVSITVGGDTVNLGNARFFGLVAAEPFDTFVLSGIDGAFGLDNIEFETVAAVPVPAALSLLLAGLGAVAGVRRLGGARIA